MIGKSSLVAWIQERFKKEEKMEEQVVPGQTRVDDIVQPDVIDHSLLLDDEKQHMNWLESRMQEAQTALDELKQKAAMRIKQEREKQIRKAAEAIASCYKDTEDEAEEICDKVKKDVKTISISFVHLSEKLAMDEFLDLIAHRMKLKPNGTLPTKSECGRAVFRWLVKNPGKIGIIPDEEAEKHDQ